MTYYLTVIQLKQFIGSHKRGLRTFKCCNHTGLIISLAKIIRVRHMSSRIGLFAFCRNLGFEGLPFLDTRGIVGIG